MWRLRWWLHKAIGLQTWERPSEFIRLRAWALWAWNEYDDWLFDGIHGFRILGCEFDTAPRWLNRVCWKILPLIRRYVVKRLPTNYIQK